MKHYTPPQVSSLDFTKTEKAEYQPDLVARMKQRSRFMSVISEMEKELNDKEYEKVGEVKVFVDESAPYSGIDDTVSIYKKKEPEPEVKCKSLFYPSAFIIPDGDGHYKIIELCQRNKKD